MNRNDEAFKVIKDFIFTVKAIMKKYKSVALWNRLLVRDKTQKVKDRTIKAFLDFLTKNKSIIVSKEKWIFPMDTFITYKSDIRIHVNHLLEMCDEDDLEVVKEYILTIDALLSKDPKSLEMLKEMEEKNSSKGSDILQNLKVDGSTKEGEYINNLVGKLGGVIGDGSREMSQQEIIMKLMTSGVLNEMTSGAKEKIDKGEITMSGMFSALQSVVQKLENPNLSPESDQSEKAQKSEKTQKSEKSENFEEVQEEEHQIENTENDVPN